MKIRNLLLICILALACVGCKSIPAEVRAAHDTSLELSAAAFVEAEDLIAKVRTPVAELNDEYVTALYQRWVESISKLIQQRSIVRTYLDEEKEYELESAYGVGHDLISDLAVNFSDLAASWEEIATFPDKDRVDGYLGGFTRDIARFRELERKFDEWIKQFPVKG